MPSQSLIDYRKIPVSLIATVFNEQSNIIDFLKSYQQQSLLAQEFIIVDASSTDGTNLLIKEFSQKHKELNIKLFIKKSNRSQARNFAVSKTNTNYLAFTDAGCLLDRLWLEELLKELSRSKCKVVGGFFQGRSSNLFQEAVVPYFLQLHKNVNAKNFYPTTRSMSIEKQLYLDLNGFNEKLELSEDYQLVLKIKQKKIPIAFAKKALVYWLPPQNFRSFLSKIAAFAKSDIEAGIIRPKVLLIYLRYVVFIILFLYLPAVFYSIFVLYLLWSIYKNQHNCQRSWYYLPLLQISSDLMVIIASLLALPKFNSRAL